MRYNVKKELYEYVEFLRRYLGITAKDYPVDVLNLCYREGTTNIAYHSFDTDGFCAAAFVGNVLDTIILNSNRSDDGQNFDCGHEVVHLTKHRDNNDGIFNCFIKNQNSYLEWEANEGSAELIVSSRLFIPDVAAAYPYLRNYSSIVDFKRAMMTKYHATAAMIDCRLGSLKYEIAQYMNGVPYENIVFLSGREQQRQGIKISSVIDLENSFLNEYWRFRGA